MLKKHLRIWRTQKEKMNAVMWTVRVSDSATVRTTAICAREKFRETPFLPDRKSSAKVARSLEYGVSLLQK